MSLLFGYSSSLETIGEDINMQGNRIINLPGPASDSEPVTKSYADTHYFSGGGGGQRGPQGPRNRKDRKEIPVYKDQKVTKGIPVRKGQKATKEIQTRKGRKATKEM